MKKCNRCNKEKPISDFFKNIKRSDGVQTYCKICHLEYGRERYANPKAFKRRQMNGEIYKKRRQASSRKWYLKATYNITEIDYNTLFNKTFGQCYICNIKVDYWLHVDHDHNCCPGAKSCGKCIRGLLCHNCNSLLGHAKDSTDILMKAAKYLSNG
jgi:hypothetical protein